jgi:hypothetical protein
MPAFAGMTGAFMVEHNVALKTAKFLGRDLVLDILLWPLWWYSTGLINAFLRFTDFIRQGNDELALLIWVRNLFVPMYGDHSLEGRLVSFLMRVFQIIGRFILFLGWCLVGLAQLALWFVLPVFVIYQILFNLNIVIIN